MLQMIRWWLVIGFIGLAQVSYGINYNDGVPILTEGSNPTETQENAIRAGAKVWCSDKPDQEREQCALDYFIAHNYEGEPSCD